MSVQSWHAKIYTIAPSTMLTGRAEKERRKKNTDTHPHIKTITTIEYECTITISPYDI